MARSYRYAVLTAVPNPRRGERVNVGVIVFRPDGFDVRFKQAEYKLRALTGDNWKSRIESAEERLKCLFDPNIRAELLVEKIKTVDPLFQPSGLGYLEPESEGEYNVLVDQILSSLVTLPKRERTSETKSRINTEIAAVFRKHSLLASKDQTIEDHKVVRNFEIDPNEGIVADFAFKNGKLLIASTLDLRKAASGIEHAALSSIKLDKARRRYKEVKTIGVYAVDNGMRENFSSHLRLLSEYADDLYDWSDYEDSRSFQRTVFKVLNVDDLGLLNGAR